VSTAMEVLATINAKKRTNSQLSHVMLSEVEDPCVRPRCRPHACGGVCTIQPDGMRPRLSAALMAGPAAAMLSRRLGRGGGRSSPATWCRGLRPPRCGMFTRSLPNGSIIVSGNGGEEPGQ